MNKYYGNNHMLPIVGMLELFWVIVLHKVK
jgi:hypothetical protein